MSRDRFPPASRTSGGSSTALAALPPFRVGRPASRAIWEMGGRPQVSETRAAAGATCAKGRLQRSGSNPEEELRKSNWRNVEIESRWLKGRMGEGRMLAPSTWTLEDGAIAQLGERLNGIQEVTGSIPVSSTEITEDFLRKQRFWVHGCILGANFVMHP